MTEQLDILQGAVDRATATLESSHELTDKLNTACTSELTGNLIMANEFLEGMGYYEELIKAERLARSLLTKYKGAKYHNDTRFNNVLKHANSVECLYKEINKVYDNVTCEE